MLRLELAQKLKVWIYAKVVRTREESVSGYGRNICSDARAQKLPLTSNQDGAKLENEELRLTRLQLNVALKANIKPILELEKLVDYFETQKNFLLLTNEKR